MVPKMFDKSVWHRNSACAFNLIKDRQIVNRKTGNTPKSKEEFPWKNSPTKPAFTFW